MRFSTIPIGRINPAPYNPRKDLQPGDREYEKLARSLDEFGCVEPLVWNERSGNLVGGHQRFKALLAKDVQELTVSVVDLPIEREKALNIALNRISGDWDDAKLAHILDELLTLPDFDVALTGFDDNEIDRLLDQQRLLLDEDEFDFDAELEKAGPPITQPGDVIDLGPHRLVCGDCTNTKIVDRTLDGMTRPRLLLTDPPYNVAYTGADRPSARGKPKPNRRWRSIENDSLTDEAHERLIQQAMTNAIDALDPGGAFYIWCGQRMLVRTSRLLEEELGSHVASVITWSKERFAPSYADYNP